MTSADAILKARDLWGPDAFATTGRTNPKTGLPGVKSVGYYETREDGSAVPLVLGRGQTFERAFEEAEGKE
jgi:hypothetical protein